MLNIQHSGLPLVMGILNVTPDSFSDGGVHFDQSKAVHAALQMEEDGAAIIDIGGESTRPGAEPLAAQGEIDRVGSVIEPIPRRSNVTISIHTRQTGGGRKGGRAGGGNATNGRAGGHPAGGAR